MSFEGLYQSREIGLYKAKGLYLTAEKRHIVWEACSEIVGVAAFLLYRGSLCENGMNGGHKRWTSQVWFV